MATDSQQIRIAIACVALRHKPPQVSCQAYTLELQEKFPLRCVGCAVAHRPSRQWKDKTDILAKELEELRSKYDDEHAELLTLRACAQFETPSVKPACQLPKPASIPPKKKQKKNPSPLHEHEQASSGRLFDNLQDFQPEMSSSDSLLVSLRMLDALASRSDCSSDEGKELIFLATERALRAFVKTLSSVLLPDNQVTPKAEVLDNLATLLDRLLTSVIPLVCTAATRKKKKRLRTTQHDRLDDLFGYLATALLAPLIRSIPTLSLAFVTAVLQPNSNKGSAPSLPRQSSCDLRPSVLNYIKVALNSLLSLSSNYPGNLVLLSGIRSVYDLLLLELVRSLESLYPPPSEVSSMDPMINGESHGVDKHTPQKAPAATLPTPHYQRDISSPRTADRLQKLARKDAVWYLCSIMQLTITASAASASSPSYTLSSSPSPSSSGSCLQTHLSASTPSSSSSAAAKSMAKMIPEPTPASQSPKSSHRLHKPPSGQPGPQFTHDADSSKTLLAQGVCTALSALLRRIPPADSHARCSGSRSGRSEEQRRCQLGETERAMILAVAEKLWLSQG